jgi:hypothetical protein
MFAPVAPSERALPPYVASQAPGTRLPDATSRYIYAASLQLCTMGRTTAGNNDSAGATPRQSETICHSAASPRTMMAEPYTVASRGFVSNSSCVARR